MDTIIADAIRDRERLDFSYPPGNRLIEPHVLGRSGDGNLLLRAYQFAGASASGEHENWKLFRLDRVGHVSPSGQQFSGPRSGYNPNDRAMKGGIIERL